MTDAEEPTYAGATNAPAQAAPAGRRGGWRWVLVPVLLMFVGAGLAFAAFTAWLGNARAARAAALGTGPVILSLVHVALFAVAARQLRRSGTSVREVIGYRRESLGSDAGQAFALAVGGVAIFMAARALQAPLFGDVPIPFHRWAIVWWTLVTGVTAGVAEELYFRGFLFRRLGFLSAPALVGVTSLAFSMWHIAPGLL
ncbi:CPBP family intramembrane glutamic endopeptidase, partial [Longimicrobium sp.]|uniref:CPBP family intramembrane glutamic endopeptidase n=1 Tax=Longimicrobium sp. TaxID=2029185 RepID=UPI002F930BC8